MSLQMQRPLDPALHPLAADNYRIATPAIEAFYELVVRCRHYRIMGALIYGLRIGKTHAIECLRLLPALNYPRVTSYHTHCEHKPGHADGPLLSNLLEAVGDPDPKVVSDPSERLRLSLRIREAVAVLAVARS